MGNSNERIKKMVRLNEKRKERVYLKKNRGN